MSLALPEPLIDGDPRDFIAFVVARLATGLEPDDRAAFCASAEAAIEAMPATLLGPGAAFRVIERVWAGYFHPRTDLIDDEPQAPPKPRQRRLRRPGEAPVGRAGIPQPIAYGGTVFPSRDALAKHLSPLCADRDPDTINGALVHLGDDGDKVVAYYAARTFRYDGRTFHSQTQLVTHLAHKTGWSGASVAIELKRCGNDPDRAAAALAARRSRCR